MGKALKEFPKLFAGFLYGMVIALLTKVELFLFVILGVAVGFAASPIVGFCVAWGLYTVFYMLSQYAMLFSSKADAFLRLIVEHERRKQ